MDLTCLFLWKKLRLLMSDDGQHILSSYQGFLAHFYCRLEEAEHSQFKFSFGEKAQKEALEHINKQINMLKEEMKTAQILYG